jgi:hypothetical protein
MKARLKLKGAETRNLYCVIAALEQCACGRLTGVPCRITTANNPLWTIVRENKTGATWRIALCCYGSIIETNPETITKLD